MCHCEPSPRLAVMQPVMPMRLNPCFSTSSPLSLHRDETECNASPPDVSDARLERVERFNVKTWNLLTDWIDYTIGNPDCPSQKVTKFRIFDSLPEQFLIVRCL